MSTIRLWVNDERTVLVRAWLSDADGQVVEVCLRDDPSAIWGPPIRVVQEKNS